MATPPETDTDRIIAAQAEQGHKTRVLLAWLLVGIPVIGAIVWLIVVSSLFGSDDTGSPTPPVQEPTTFTMTGTLELPLADSVQQSAPCHGTVSDGSLIQAGTSVVIFDESGKQVATDPLGAGIAAKDGGQTVCQFALTVTDVPIGLPSYEVQVGALNEQQVPGSLAHGHVVLTGDGS